MQVHLLFWQWLGFRIPPFLNGLSIDPKHNCSHIRGLGYSIFISHQGHRKSIIVQSHFHSLFIFWHFRALPALYECKKPHSHKAVAPESRLHFGLKNPCIFFFHFVPYSKQKKFHFMPKIAKKLHVVEPWFDYQIFIFNRSLFLKRLAFRIVLSHFSHLVTYYI